MKTKAKGFTLIELIITLAITVVVLGVIYTFYFTSNKSLSTTAINSDLQSEAQSIEKELIFYGTQSDGLIKINDIDIVSGKKDILYSIIPIDGNIPVTNIVFKGKDVAGIDKCYRFIRNNNTLIFEQLGADKVKVESSEVLSENIIDFKVRPLDFRVNKSGNFSKAPGIEVTLIINKKKGYSDVSIPVSTIVKFRNKQ